MPTLLFLFLLFRYSQAAHSRRRVVTTRPSSRYDRSITEFDPSGRMLQVEYGMAAAGRGSPVLAVVINNTIVVGVGQSGQMHRLADHIWLVTAGLQGDASALADSLREYGQRHRLAYGEQPTVEQVARQAASAQHELTRTGGARPLGCTAIVLGIDFGGSARVFRTDPGGILEDCWYAAGGQNQETMMNLLGERFEDIEKIAGWAKKSASVAKVMAEAASDKKLNIDLWVIRPDPRRRGGMHATCLRSARCTKLSQRAIEALEMLDKGAT